MLGYLRPLRCTRLRLGSGHDWQVVMIAHLHDRENALEPFGLTGREADGSPWSVSIAACSRGLNSVTSSTPFGFMAKLTPSWGGQATSGAQALWGQETMAGMPHGGVASGGRQSGQRIGYSTATAVRNPRLLVRISPATKRSAAAAPEIHSPNPPGAKQRDQAVP